MKFQIALNNRKYEVEVEFAESMTMQEFQTYAPAPAAPAAPAAAPTVEAAPAAPGIAGNGESVNSPMPGTILRVNVTPGQTVKEGAVLVILEAMKMENEIKAPRNGTITQVLVSKGASVDTDAPLVLIG